jgi:hypothetical protein
MNSSIACCFTGARPHIADSEITYLQKTLGASFQTETAVDVWIVGSAKLGFSITEKGGPDGSRLPRYRPFGPQSDIDVAVISQGIFNLIWNDLSAHAHQTPRLPWDSKALGDYLVCGWLRPDHFPKRVRLRSCDLWWDLFRSFSANRKFGARKVRGGLFADVDHLRRYLSRAVTECYHLEGMAE